jgi:hypothetical protein
MDHRVLHDIDSRLDSLVVSPHLGPSAPSLSRRGSARRPVTKVKILTHVS